MKKKLKLITRDSGTPAFSPPESKRDNWNAPITSFEKSRPLEFIQKGDVYSLGLLYYYMRLPENLSMADRNTVINDASQTGFSNLRRSTDPSERFIYRMLQKDPGKRPNISEVVAFFEEREKTEFKDILAP